MRAVHLQDDLQDGAGPSGDQQEAVPQPDALEEEAAAAARPDQNGADGESSARPTKHVLSLQA